MVIKIKRDGHHALTAGKLKTEISDLGPSFKKFTNLSPLVPSRFCYLMGVTVTVSCNYGD